MLRAGEDNEVRFLFDKACKRVTAVFLHEFEYAGDAI